MTHQPTTALRVWWNGSPERRLVGRLVWRDRRAWFEFDPGFLEHGADLSPFHLPFRAGVSPAPPEPFRGLHGVFEDSLPDGWGRLLQDKQARSIGLSPARLTPLDRLAWVGDTGLGALSYEPEIPYEQDLGHTLDALAAASAEILRGASSDVLPELLRLGGSPQGARPKARVWLRPSDLDVSTAVLAPTEEHVAVLVKFRSAQDAPEAGVHEHAYLQLAKTAGIDVPRAWLLPSRTGPPWFAVERFDRRGAVRSHIHTLCGLLHADHRLPSLDYIGAMTAVGRLTRNEAETVRMFRRMVFNVVVHNRDDHTKQTSLMIRDGAWTLAPAYDLTFSEGPGGEHSMAVAGRGVPDRAAVLDAGQHVGLGSRLVDRVLQEVQDRVVGEGLPTEMVRRWVRL